MKSDVSPQLVEVALEYCERTPFEKFAQVVFGAVMGPKFKPMGGMHDGGADGVIFDDIFEQTGKPTIFFQASKQVTVETKINETIARLRAVGREVKQLHFASSLQLPMFDQLEFKLGEKHSCSIRIHDRGFFAQRANFNADTLAAFETYLKPAVSFLEKRAAPSFPQSPPFQNAQAVCAFLSQEVEARLGTSKTLESVCDALICWALEDTDPVAGNLMTAKEITEKVEAVIPTAQKFFRSQIDARLAILAKKVDGARSVNIYKKAAQYCLPFETREALKAHTIEAEKLRADVTASLLTRLLAEADKSVFETSILGDIAPLLHKTLDAVFSHQGFEAAQHFLNDNLEDKVELDTQSISDIASRVLDESSISSNLRPEIHLLMKKVLRGVFYDATDVERQYCARLSRTYILLFTIRNTPEIIEYFNSMAKNFRLYVGSDLIIRAISEYYLHESDQMTVNAFKIIKQAGSKIILSEAMLEEVHSHIWAAHLEYKNHYLEVDAFVDRDLAAQCDRILIRAYYYSKLDIGRTNKPTNWSAYLRNFLSPEKLSGPLSEGSMKSLKDTLCNRFGFDFESKEETSAGLDPDEIEKLTDKIKELRRHNKGQEDIRAENDAIHILRVHRSRLTHEKSVGNPFGYRTWWITQDTVSGRAAALVFPNRKETRYVMRPEFLINYIAYNPTTDSVRESLKSIFPSLLGVKLGTRLDKKIVHAVLDRIREGNAIDPARAEAIVTEHADALKSNQMRHFVIKYARLADEESLN